MLMDDPVFLRALTSLREASTKYQAQVALNLLKIMTEHHLELQTSGRQGQAIIPIAGFQQWYDANEALKSALKLLEGSPKALEAFMIAMISDVLEETLETIAS